MSAEVEDVIAETAAKAKKLLFDAKGKRRPEKYFIALSTLQSVLRPATIAEIMNGCPVFDWRGTTLIYDAQFGNDLLRSARKNPFCDQVLCGNDTRCWRSLIRPPIESIYLQSS